MINDNGNNNILIFSLVFVFLLLIAELFLYLCLSNKNKITKRVSQNSTLPSITTVPTIVTKPIYTAEDYVTFAHYYFGYTIEYPAKNVDFKLVGLDGNFSQKYDDGSSILVYEIFPERNTISKITIDNIEQQLTTCGDGGCWNFFINKDDEKIQEKKIANLNGSKAYWIKTIIPIGSTSRSIPHIPTTELTTIERFIIPKKDSYLLLELNYKDKISPELSKAFNSFRIIPSIPSNWVEYKKNDNSKISFKSPTGYEITEDVQKKQIEIKSPTGTISLSYYDINDGPDKYLTDPSQWAYLDLKMGYKAEKGLSNDITKLKFSINAFLYQQGGDNSIRVFDPDRQEVTVYFYAYDSSLIYRITSPQSMEMVMNQILMSVNELMAL